MASSVFILDLKGKPLIQKAYRGDLPASCIDHFAQHVVDEDEENIKPLFEHNGITFAWVKHNNLYFVVATRLNCNITMLFVFLYKTVDVFTGYFERVEEESIRDNFCMIYELMDEMMDFGYPQFTETNILKQYITQEGFKLKQIIEDLKDDGEGALSRAAAPAAAASGAAGGVPWRQPGIRHRKNEMFLDVVERVNMLINANGETLHSEIHGTLEMTANLSGMPELKLGVNDKILFENAGRRTKRKTVDLEDVKFHQCVKLNRFESDRTIFFIPPDGQFELMTYRLNTKVKPMVLVQAQMQKHGQTRLEYLVKCKSQFKKNSTARNVLIQVPVPSDADTPQFKTTAGSAKYAPDKDVIVWKIKLLPGGKECMLRATFGLPSIRSDQEAANLPTKRPISVNFEIPFFTVSGFQVRYLKLSDKSTEQYQAQSWVRYITQSGDYQIRMT